MIMSQFLPIYPVQLIENSEIGIMNSGCTELEEDFQEQ